MLLILFLGLRCPGKAPGVLGQDRVAVSVKHILNLELERSPGDYTDDEQIGTAIGEANQVLANNEAEWRILVTEIVNVAGAAPFFRIGTQEQLLELERTAMQEPEKYAFRTSAINIYIVDHLITPGTRGVSSLPVELEDRTRHIIVLNNRGIRRGGIGWLHEIGHYLSLTHTFQQPFGIDGNAVECTAVAAWHCSPEGVVEEVRCPDSCPDTFNVMSYNSFSLDEARLSPCQLGEMAFELYDPAGKRSAVLLPSRFVRGDANDDGGVNLGDGVYSLLHLFASGSAPSCLDAADADDSGALDIADALFTFSYLFAGGASIPEPNVHCGVDRTQDPLTCEYSTPCAQ